MGRIVHRLTNPPHKCIVSGFSDGPFLDTGVESPYIEPWVAFNVQVLKDLAKEVGMVPEEELAAANEIIAELEHRVHQLDLQIQEQDSYLDGIDGLTKAGYMVRKAPGRPKKKAAA
jgi:hypothetical protein